MNKISLKIKTEDLIFDLIIILSGILMQFVRYSTIKNMSDFVTISAGILVPISLSYKMGSFFIHYRKYNKNYVKILLFFASIFIFPLILVSCLFFFEIQKPEPFSSENYTATFISLFIVITGVILGMKFTKRNNNFDKQINIAMTIIASLAFTLFENYIFIIVNLKHDNSVSEFIMFIGLIIVNGYLPYRLVMAFAPPKNKINILVGVFAIIVTIILLTMKFFNV